MCAGSSGPETAGTGANASQAQFGKASLEGASFAGAKLTYADFSHADVRGADFSGASLFRARFHKSRQDHATFTNRALVLGDDDQLARAEAFPRDGS